LYFLQDVQLTDQSHIIGAEMSVYEDNGYSASDEPASAAQWFDGYSAPSASDTAPSGSALKLRVSNRQFVGLVTVALLLFTQL